MTKLMFQNIEIELYQETEPGAATLVIEGTERIVEFHIQIYPSGIVVITPDKGKCTPVSGEGATAYFIGNSKKGLA